MKTETVAVDDLIFDTRNARTHSDRNLQEIEASLRRFGQQKPIVVSSDGVVLAGNGTLQAARSLGWKEISVHRTTLSGAEATAYAIADNRTAELADWDRQVLGELLAEMEEAEEGLDGIGFDDDEIEKLITEVRTVQVGDPGEEDDDDDDEPEGSASEPEEEGESQPQEMPEPTTRQGDVWVLGNHRVMCGDSVKKAHVIRLLAGSSVDLVCSDPPYCSGGFQETAKSQGSVGTSATHKQVANDRLSTRGYQSLLKTAFGNMGAKYLYAFTDWRMWVYLFDIVESLGFGVRSMIVWDKGTPGMGRGWRAQHELVMFGASETPPFDKHAPGHGNVIQASRTGNKLHTTQKPVELMVQLLAAMPFAQTVSDPFNGSGSTLMACEKEGRTYFGMELDPHYVDTTIRRWQEETGGEAIHEESGQTFAER